MDIKQFIKIQASQIANFLGMGCALRYMFRNRLLVIMYHGVTTNNYSPSAWTQLPVNLFQQQIEWLKKHYHPVSLSEVVDAISTKQLLPERSVLITFDDGLKNNATVVYPILKKFNFPAAIFIPVDFIGTDYFLWVDDLWLLIYEAIMQKEEIILSSQQARLYFSQRQYWESYQSEVEHLKLTKNDERLKVLDTLREQITYDKGRYRNDFGMLSWQDVMAMDNDGLVEFGVHTATHRILTTIPPDQLDEELFGAKEHLERKLNHCVDTFCYPNGRPDTDYLSEHKKLLVEGGYKCSFASNWGLWNTEKEDAFSIPRVSAGNDFLSNRYFFQLNSSGLCEFIK